MGSSTYHLAPVLPLILRPIYPGRPLSPQLPALSRVMTANTAATPGALVLRRRFLPSRTAIQVGPLLHLVHPAAQLLPRRRIRRHGRLQNVHILEEQVRQLQSQLARLKNQAASGPPKPNTAYKATPSEPFINESEPREYGLHARTSLSNGSSIVWLDDDSRASTSAEPLLSRFARTTLKLTQKTTMSQSVALPTTVTDPSGSGGG